MNAVNAVNAVSATLSLADHLVVAPILLPMLAAALMLLTGSERFRLQAVIGDRKSVV